MATLDNCDSASGFTATSGTIVADTGTYNSAPASLLMTLSTGQNWCDFYKSFTYQDTTSFSFYYNILNYTYYDYAEIYFSDGGSDYFYYVITPSSNGWQQITFNKSAMSSSGLPNWATVNTWGVYFQKSGSGYPSMYFDTFEYTPASSPVSISATVINIDAEGIAPSISIPAEVTTSIIGIDIEGIAPTVDIGSSVSISSSTINVDVEGIAPSISIPCNVEISTINIEVEGIVPTVDVSTDFDHKYGINLYAGTTLTYTINISEGFTLLFYCKLESDYVGTLIKFDNTKFLIGYNGTKFWYQKGGRITAGLPRTLPTGLFKIAVQSSKIMILTDDYIEILE